MKTQLLTIEQLKHIKVITVEQGKQLASDILSEQLELHRQMQYVSDIKEWPALMRSFRQFSI